MFIRKVYYFIYLLFLVVATFAVSSFHINMAYLVLISKFLCRKDPSDFSISFHFQNCC